MKRVLSAACAALVLCCVGTATAHPMPNTVIEIAHTRSGMRLDIALPESDLTLAMSQSHEAPSGTDASSRAAIEAYLRRHLTVRSTSDMSYPYTIDAVSRLEAVDDNVGRYSEIRVSLVVPTRDGLNPRDFTLAYDAVIHQIPNHLAVVQFVDDFRNGILQGSPPRFAGTIGFDFTRNTVAPLRIQSNEGSLWTGVRAVITQRIIAKVSPLLLPLALLTVALLGSRRSLSTIGRTMHLQTDRLGPDQRHPRVRASDARY
ncbi:MAG: hypothetical protein U0Q11_12535 [Vicinamibacterales bacterium]